MPFSLASLTLTDALQVNNINLNFVYVALILPYAAHSPTSVFKAA
jgi:hypothetical protein